jgi:hypothetical protein
VMVHWVTIVKGMVLDSGSATSCRA